MSQLVELIREVQELGLPAGRAADLFERALQALLGAEGPPATPIAGISSTARTAIARSPKGRPLFLCHTWSTADWTCLLLDLPPVVMGRPVFIKNPSGGPGRVVTDYQSQKFQRRLVAACAALELQPPPEPSHLVSRLSPGRLFLAWAPLEGTPPALKGDLDNYAKNVMDGLQRARIVPNDRTIAAIGFSREDLPAADESLDDRLIALLLELRAAHPKLNQRKLARLAGVSQRACRRLLTLAEASGASAPETNALAPSGPVSAPTTLPKVESAPPAAPEAPQAPGLPVNLPAAGDPSGGTAAGVSQVDQAPQPAQIPPATPALPSPQPVDRSRLRRRQQQLERDRRRRRTHHL